MDFSEIMYGVIFLIVFFLGIYPFLSAALSSYTNGDPLIDFMIMCIAPAVLVFWIGDKL